MIKISLALLTGIFASVLAGCAKVDSADIRTSGFYAEIHISTDDETTTVFARLRTGRAIDADTIILSPGDQLAATLSGNIIALNRTDTDAYRGVFEVATGGSEVKVALSRINDTDAQNSRVTLPNAFEITAPGLAESFNAGESITVVWSPGAPSNTVEVGYSLNCQVLDENGNLGGATFGRSFEVVDSGTHTASVNQILNVVGTQDELVRDVSCPLEVTVTRTNNGTLDPAFSRGGTIKATREKSVLVNVVP